MTLTIEVAWSIGEDGRPHNVFTEIQSLLEKRCSLTCEGIDRTPKGDSAYIVIFEFDKDDSEKYGRHGYLEGESPWVGFLWDWKEPRKSMIEDLYDAMKFFGREIIWKLTEGSK